MNEGAADGDEREGAAHTMAGASRRPRVLVVTHLFPTPERPVQGPWVAEQVDALTHHADVSVLCCSPFAQDGTQVRASGVHVTYRHTATPLGTGRAGLIGSTIRYRKALARHLAEHPGGFDLLHAHFGFPDAVVVAAAAKRTGLPYVITLHGDDGLYVLKRQDPVGKLVRDAVTGAARTFVVSPAMERSVRETLGEAGRVTFAPNGYDGDIFTPSHTERRGVLFVGLLVPVKNLPLLLDAYAESGLTAEDPLTIAGDGPLAGELKAQADRLGIADRVRFAGSVDRAGVAALMRSARCLTLPSASEGWPLVVCEALACGTPVVASRVGGIPDIMAGTQAGALVEPGDEIGLRDALARIVGASHDPAVVAASSTARPWRQAVQPIAETYRELAEGTAS